MHLLDLPPEMLGQVLSQLRCGRALGRFSAASVHCRDVAVSTASAWQALLPKSVLLPEAAATPVTAAAPDTRELVRRWHTLSDCSWSRTRLRICSEEDKQPPRRFLQRAALLSPTDIIMFGGSSQDPRAHTSQYFNDMWHLSADTGDLRELPAQGQCREELIPAPRTAFSFTTVSADTAFLFGGHTIDDGFTNDLWKAVFTRSGAAIVGVTWTRIGGGAVDSSDSSDSSEDGSEDELLWPHARQGHSATLVDGLGIVLFGGSFPSRVMNDTWLFEIQHQRFRRIICSGPLPKARAGHVGVPVDIDGQAKCVLIFGGNTSEDTLAPELWSLQIGNGVDTPWLWSQVNVAGNTPSARIGHSAVVLGGGRFAVYGGRNLFSGTQTNPTEPQGTVHVLHTSECPIRWQSVIPPAGSCAPFPRTGHAACQVLFIFPSPRVASRSAQLLVCGLSVCAAS
jgi:hypothetical protein